MSEKARIRWRCRRGMKELDVLLERFVANEYDRLDGRGRAALRTLLEKEDPDLYALLMARGAPDDAAQADLLKRIARYTQPT